MLLDFPKGQFDEHNINKNCTMSEESKKEAIQASISQVEETRGRL